MKKLLMAVGLFGFISVMATLFVWWDTAPAHTSMAKYRLGQNKDLGLIAREAPKPGPALWKFECIGSEKDCGTKPIPAVVHSVPEPGTLVLIGLGLGLLGWARRR